MSKMSKQDILKYGNLYYLEKIDKVVKPQQYEPVSYENWKLLRELEPTKFRDDYDTYVRLKEKQFNDEVERRKNVELELKVLTYSLRDDDIESTKENIKNTQKQDRFEKWVNDELVKSILDY